MNSVGRYSLLVSDNGEYAVEWIEGKHHYIVRLPELVRVIDEIVVRDLAARKHFAKVFKMAFAGNDEAFINSPESAILNHLNDNETTPDKKIKGEQLFEFNVKKFLLAYNRWKGTSLKYREVEKLCR